MKMKNTRQQEDLKKNFREIFQFRVIGCKSTVQLRGRSIQRKADKKARGKISSS